MIDLLKPFIFNFYIHGALISSLLVLFLSILIVYGLLKIEKVSKFLMAILSLVFVYFFLFGFFAISSSKIVVEYCRQDLSLSDEEYSCYLYLKYEKGSDGKYIAISAVSNDNSNNKIYSIKSGSLTDKNFPSNDVFYIKLNSDRDLNLRDQLAYDLSKINGTELGAFDNLMNQRLKIKEQISLFFNKKKTVSK